VNIFSYLYSAVFAIEFRAEAAGRLDLIEIIPGNSSMQYTVRTILTSKTFVKLTSPSPRSDGFGRPLIGHILAQAQLRSRALHLESVPVFQVLCLGLGRSCQFADDNQKETGRSLIATVFGIYS
jgi:hypothetical protein